MFRFAFAAAITLATIAQAGAQGLPAFEAEGSQSQSLSVAKDMVNVSVETDGAVSLSRHATEARGGLGVDVNGISVQLGGENDASGAAAAPGGKAADGQRELSGERSGVPVPDASEACLIAQPSTADLDSALARRVPVRLRSADCVVESPALAASLASEPLLIDGLTARGLGPEQVFAITISDEFVTLDVGILP